MTEVVSVRFKSRGKSYYFDPKGHQVRLGQSVVVETSKGLELGECVRGNFLVEPSKVIPPLRPVLRLATEEDLKMAEENRERETEAFRTGVEKIREHELDMKLVDVEYNFEGNKILFFFTSDGRVDFRELVRDLAGVFRTRIELRQIGVRDEAKILGGLGICGKPFCCSQFLDDFQPVSIKMAKTQNLSLNPTKISGTCGRLMCCLKYEQDAYEELVKNAPKLDSYVDTPDGKGTITEINLLRQKAKVRLETRGGDPAVSYFPLEEIQFIKTGKQRRAELAAEAKDQQDTPGREGAPQRGLQQNLGGRRPGNQDQNAQKEDAPKREGQKPRDSGRRPEKRAPETIREPQETAPQAPADEPGGERNKNPRPRRRRRPGGKGQNGEGGHSEPPQTE